MDAADAPRLFVVYVGGSVPGAHVELHDLRFAVGRQIEDCYPALRAGWWGTPESLHLDAWGPLLWADGWEIVVDADAAPPPDGAMRLWHVNLGGYDPTQFTELHANVFTVAPEARTAKRRALAQIAGWTAPHKDVVTAVGRAVDVAGAAGAALRLRPDPTPRPFRFETRYVPIGAAR